MGMLWVLKENILKGDRRQQKLYYLYTVNDVKLCIWSPGIKVPEKQKDRGFCSNILLLNDKIFLMVFKSNGANKTKTSKVPPSSYCIIFNVLYMAINCAKFAHCHFVTFTTNYFKTIYPSIQNLAVSSSDDRPVFRRKALSKNNYLIDGCKFSV